MSNLVFRFFPRSILGVGFVFAVGHLGTKLGKREVSPHIESQLTYSAGLIHLE
jgi:hypothetical protein